eukprot:TRINITY_DN1332_c0_g1_i3.p2 TRINITY_DN1332_c0_g1~~TRINITY_DN1332_c0_g1_i3.p2  ORF type:complete len:510 (-),score=203.58 TRINITY_DN1332_c0_g1_i3:744-2273(-)
MPVQECRQVPTVKILRQKNQTGPKPVILLVDDNIDMRDYLSGLFKKLYQVDLASNGIEALDVIHKKRIPNLILSDVSMPRMDGYKLLAALRADRRTKPLPVILLSARSGEEARVEGLQAGADDYLVKPFSAKELLARVNTHLELSKLRVELESQVQVRVKELLSAKTDLEVEIREKEIIELALKDSEERYRTLARVSPVGIFYTTPDGKTTYLNERWCEITCYGVGETEEEGWMTGINLKDKARVQAQWEISTREEKAFLAEFRYRRPTGHITWVLGQALPDLSTSGKILGFVGSITDISERKQLEKEKIAALKRAEQEQREGVREAQEHQLQLERFIDMICHEIRNPLNGIFNNLDLLKSGVQIRERLLGTVGTDSPEYALLKKEVKEDFDAIEAIDICAKQQRIISDDVLDVSRLDTDKVVLSSIIFQPNEILNQTAKMFHSELVAKNIHIYLNLPFEPVTIKGDPARLLQIFSNLIANAIKFTHPAKGKKGNYDFSEKFGNDRKTS